MRINQTIASLGDWRRHLSKTPVLKPV